MKRYTTYLLLVTVVLLWSCGAGSGRTAAIEDQYVGTDESEADGRHDSRADFLGDGPDGRVGPDTDSYDLSDMAGDVGDSLVDTDSGCVFDCGGKECGGDGCGGLCGECLGDQVCYQGHCIQEPCQEGLECDDLNMCTFGDVCTSGVCAGMTYICNDDRACTKDECDGLGDCLFTIANGKCLINNICYTAGELRTGKPCEECIPASSKTEWTKDDTNPCSDGDACTVGDICSDGTCLPGTSALDCPYPGQCKTIACVPEEGCVVTNVEGLCNDENACTIGDYCVEGVCNPGIQSLPCDPVQCLSAECDPLDGCVYYPAPGPCNDGDNCTENDTCDAGLCIAGTPKAACNDNNLCTNDSCINNGICVHTPNSVLCNDGNECTTADICSQGQCGGTLIVCNDNNGCTTDYCNPFLPGGCTYQMNDNSCSDSDPCTLGDTCNLGECVAGLGKPDCNDDNECTLDNCTPYVGCTHTNMVAYCSDGNGCTLGDYCANGICVGGTNICQCQKDSDCAEFDDGNLCNGTMFCDMSPPNPANWACQVDLSTIVMCSPQYDTSCLVNTCVSETGKCSYQPVNENLSCDDEDSCTLNDSCLAGTCTGSPCSILSLYCVNGACGPQLCTPNTSRCDGSMVMKCNSSGTDEATQTVCSPTQYCAESGGTAFCTHQICSPNQLFCQDNKVMICDMLGASLTELEDCGTAGQWCFAGLCENLFLCGGVPCPVLNGYSVSCNSKQHCEYANADPVAWSPWDVWIYVPSGSFPMGSPNSEPGHKVDESPVHTVSFQSGFFIMKHEIVVSQYDLCMANNPTACTPPSVSDYNDCGGGLNTSAKGRQNHPQNGITWQQASAFCAWAAQDGRLASEAEWEYAATGPTHTKFPWGAAPDPLCSNETTVFTESGTLAGCGCSTMNTWPVGSKPAGVSFVGALDMGGNLWEWTEDYYHNKYDGAPTDGTAWLSPTSTTRTLRGGGIVSGVNDVRNATRLSYSPTKRNSTVGARCVRPAPAGMDFVVWPVCTPGSLGCAGPVRGTCNLEGTAYDPVEDCGANDMVCESGECIQPVASCTGSIRYGNGARFTYFESTTDSTVLAAASASLLTDGVGHYWLADSGPYPHSDIAPWYYIIDFGCRKSVAGMNALFPYNYDSFKIWSLYYTADTILSDASNWTLAGSFSESGFLATVSKSFVATPSDTRAVKIVVTSSSRGTAAIYNPDLGSIRID